jgi:hypothetical protein
MSADGSSDKRAKLGDDETAYHVSLVEQVKEAQEAQAKIVRTQAAWDNWAEYLKSKYGFTDGDTITEEGAIMYGSPPNGSASPDGSPKPSLIHSR